MSHVLAVPESAKGVKGKIIYKAIVVSFLINLHFPSNLNFSFCGMLCSASLFSQVALQIGRYFFLTRVEPYLVFLLSWISSITTFLSLSLHSEIAGRFRAHDLNFWLISSKRPSLLALLQLYINFCFQLLMKLIESQTWKNILYYSVITDKTASGDLRM